MKGNAPAMISRPTDYHIIQAIKLESACDTMAMYSHESDFLTDFHQRVLKAFLVHKNYQCAKIHILHVKYMYSQVLKERHVPIEY